MFHGRQWVRISDVGEEEENKLGLLIGFTGHYGSGST